MSKVDVAELLRDYARLRRSTGNLSVAEAMKSEAHILNAANAVAELIAADVEYDEANSAYDRAATGSPRSEAWVRVLLARARRREALACIGGAK